MSEPTEIPTDTPVAELRDRGYSITPDADLLCACGYIIGRVPDEGVWRGEHRPGWHDQDWRDRVRMEVPPGTLPTIDVPSGTLHPDAEYPTKRWILHVDLLDHTDDQLTAQQAEAARLLGLSDVSDLDAELALQLLAAEVSVSEVTAVTSEWMLVELRYRPDRKPETLIRVSCDGLLDACCAAVLHVAYDEAWDRRTGQEDEK